MVQTDSLTSVASVNLAASSEQAAPVNQVGAPGRGLPTAPAAGDVAVVSVVPAGEVPVDRSVGRRVPGAARVAA